MTSKNLNYMLDLKHHISTVGAGNSLNQEIFVVLAILGMSKAISDRQYNNITGKIPGLDNICYWTPSLLFYILHVTVRLASYAILTANYLLYGALVLPPQFLWNFLIERYVCQEKDFTVNILTAFKSLVGPACNIRRDLL